jgi:SAM-dependent methyltransferase
VPALDFLFDPDEDPLDVALAPSLRPRPATSVVETAARLVGTGDLIVDVGTRDGRYTKMLALVTGCPVVGVDPVPSQVIACGRQTPPFVGRALYAAAFMERLPLATGSAALVFCREVIEYVVDLPAAFAEVARVLRPGGHLLLTSTYLRPDLEPRERARFVAALGLIEDSMDLDRVEHEFEPAGLELVGRDLVASEWREAWIEAGDHWLEEQVLKVARLDRHRPELIEEFGEDRVEMVRAYALWGLYHMLGKTEPVVHLLRAGVRT